MCCWYVFNTCACTSIKAVYITSGSKKGQKFPSFGSLDLLDVDPRLAERAEHDHGGKPDHGGKYV